MLSVGSWTVGAILINSALLGVVRRSLLGSVIASEAWPPSAEMAHSATLDLSEVWDAHWIATKPSAPRNDAVQRTRGRAREAAP